MFRRLLISFFFFFNDTATTEIYTLSLHDALPISVDALGNVYGGEVGPRQLSKHFKRSEEHTSELQSQSNLVCRLLLEKKKKQKNPLVLDDRDKTCSNMYAQRRRTETRSARL